MANHHILDSRELLFQLNAEESRVRLKRRWLMNAPLSDKDHLKLETLNPLSDGSIPESLVRKDDAYYDTIKNFVEGVSGTSTSGKEHEHASCLKKLLPNGANVTDRRKALNGMTDEELCYLSELVTEGTVKFEKTRKRMKLIIKKHLASYLHSDLDKRKDQLSSLPENPQYLSGIREEDLSSSSESFLDSAIRVLDMLEEVPTQALAAMHRKLKGKTGLTNPALFVDRRLRYKYVLVSPLRIHCMKMLSELDEGNPPPEALVEALSIAEVMLKLLCGHTHIIEFKKFSPKVKDLQNRIVKAIHSVTYVPASLLEVIKEKLNLVSECDIEFKSKLPRVALRSRLIELLVESCNMESIPKGYVEILNDIINMAHSHTPKSLVERSKDQVEEEVEFLLCFSAQLKQVILDLLPEDEDIDQDFANAYMEEEPEDYDKEEEEDYTSEVDSSECGSVTESIGETQSPVSTPKQEPLDFSQETDSFLSKGLSSFSHRNKSSSHNRLLSETFEDQKNEAEPDDSEVTTNLQQQQCSAKNKYLSMQRACDETAMAMHRAIDGILNELAKK